MHFVKSFYCKNSGIMHIERYDCIYLFCTAFDKLKGTNCQQWSLFYQFGFWRSWVPIVKAHACYKGNNDSLTTLSFWLSNFCPLSYCNCTEHACVVNSKWDGRVIFVEKLWLLMVDCIWSFSPLQQFIYTPTQKW